MKDPLAPIIDCLIDAALGSSDFEAMFSCACTEFDRTVFPLVRVHLSMTTLHPLFDVTSMTWQRGEGIRRGQFTTARAPDDDWFSSPFHQMMEIDHVYNRYYDIRKTDHGFPILAELRQTGATGYYAMMQGFVSPPERAITKRDGMISSWATDAPGGFGDKGRAAVDRLVSRLAVCAKLYVREAMAENILYAYLGADAGKRVLDGHIKLGDGESIQAAIWYSDMRNSTPLADRLPRETFLALVNAYFDATATAVVEEGGEVLRFIGDAVLGIFRIDEKRTMEMAAAEAMQAARRAVERMNEFNRATGIGGGETFDLGIALHVGEVIFGNIGIPSRVEFSVVGSAANETARLEELNKEYKCRIVVSGDLAAALPVKDGLTDRGDHVLRGVGHPIHVYTCS
ncbi:MAG: adenylate/guanylate cyclase domain-containing protein [Alphaproteobacteria bacterium]